MVLSRKSLSVLVLVASFLWSGGLEAVPMDHVLLVDTSASMLGKGDGNGVAIFEDVKRVVLQMVEAAEQGTVLCVLAFDCGVKSSRCVVLDSDVERQSVRDFVSRLAATGECTYLTASYKLALSEIDKIYAGPAGVSKSGRQAAVFIFTDGKGNGPEDKDAKTFVDLFTVAKSDYQFLYTKFFTIGEAARLEKERRVAFGQAGIEEVNVGREYFKTNQSFVIRVLPSSLYLTPEAMEQKLELTAPVDAKGRSLELTLSCPELEGAGALLRLAPESSPLVLEGGKHLVPVRFELVNGGSLDRVENEIFDCTMTAAGKDLIISPKADIKIQYNKAPFLLVKMSTAPVRVETDGTFALKGILSKRGQPARLRFAAKLEDVPVAFGLNPDGIDFGGESKLSLVATDPAALVDWRRTLKADRLVNGVVAVECDDPNVRMEGKKVPIQILFKPHRDEYVVKVQPVTVDVTERDLVRTLHLQFPDGAAGRVVQMELLCPQMGKTGGTLSLQDKSGKMVLEKGHHSHPVSFALLNPASVKAAGKDSFECTLSFTGENLAFDPPKGVPVRLNLRPYIDITLQPTSAEGVQGTVVLSPESGELTATWDVSVVPAGKEAKLLLSVEWEEEPPFAFVIEPLEHVARNGEALAVRVKPESQEAFLEWQASLPSEGRTLALKLGFGTLEPEVRLLPAEPGGPADGSLTVSITGKPTFWDVWGSIALVLGAILLLVAILLVVLKLRTARFEPGARLEDVSGGDACPLVGKFGRKHLIVGKGGSATLEPSWASSGELFEVRPGMGVSVLMIPLEDHSLEVGGLVVSGVGSVVEVSPDQSVIVKSPDGYDVFSAIYRI